jgi:hypothetical protein
MVKHDYINFGNYLFINFVDFLLLLFVILTFLLYINKFNQKKLYVMLQLTYF